MLDADGPIPVRRGVCSVSGIRPVSGHRQVSGIRCLQLNAGRA